MTKEDIEAKADNVICSMDKHVEKALREMSSDKISSNKEYEL